MSKYLDKVIEEMGDYGDMGHPTGETSMGMGSATPMGIMGGCTGKKKIKAYKLRDLLQQRTRAEEEEDLGDIGDEEAGMDGEFGMDGEANGNDVEELKQFFIDNPFPSHEEIAAYAEEHGMDMEEMRSSVYELIQSLLSNDEEDMGNEDSMDFSVSSDTGERPASNEMDMKR